MKEEEKKKKKERTQPTETVEKKEKKWSKVAADSDSGSLHVCLITKNAIENRVLKIENS